MIFDRRRKENYYYRSFNHGKKEHNYERYSTITLTIMIAIFIIGIYTKIEILFFYILFLATLITLTFRVLAYINHKLEKKYRKKAEKIEKGL